MPELLQLQYLSKSSGELFQRFDHGFEKDFIEQMNEAYEINVELIDKVIELQNNMPKGLHRIYPDK